LKKLGTGAIFRTETNPLHNRYLVRPVWIAACIATGCGHKPAPQASPATQPTTPLPTTGLSGQQVILLPLTLVAAEDSLHWETALRDRRATLARADSVVGALLQARAPEVTWVLPSEVRRAARRAPGLATDPDQLGTAMLRVERLTVVPDPLRGQVRTLAALSGGGGGRHVLFPVALIFRRAHPSPRVTPTAIPPTGRAELGLVLADIRTGRIEWRTIARGEGDDPWTTLARAMKTITPGLP
jgi:hypothetical protein